MQAYKHLIKHAIAMGYSCSVWDGEEWQIKRSKAYREIVDAVKSVDEAELRIRDKEGNKVGWALVSTYLLEDDETVLDYTCNEFMENWFAEYEKTVV